MEPGSPTNGPAQGDEETLVSQLRALEDLKSAASAAQARAAVALDDARRLTESAAGVPQALQGRGVGAEVALARRESPHLGSRLLGLARTLVSDMPRTLTALERGDLSEWRATLIVRETICLSRENRRATDAELAADTGALEGIGSRSLMNRARKIAYRLEPQAAVGRARKAVGERYVSCRPAPDTMAYLTALLPAAEAVSAFAALSTHVDTRIGTGGSAGLGRGQLMADTLVERLTGVAHGVGRAEVQLVMTDRSLLQGDSEPATLEGYGPVPAQYARDLVSSDRTSSSTVQQERADDGMTREPAEQVWLRRLYTAPDTGQLVAMDKRSRLFPVSLRRLVSARDAACRTPYCDAPIRHIDHIVPWRDSESTTYDGGQGLCEKCNYIKEAPGWSSRPLPGLRHSVEKRTPTGHSYVSTAPSLPGGGSAEAVHATKACTADPRPAHSVIDLILHPAAAA